MAKKILITGGNGFLGKNIAQCLLKRHEVCAPSHKELELSDESAVARYLKDKNFDFVVHTAAKPGHRFAKDTSGILDTNTRIFFNLIKNSDRFGKMICIGSGLVYGQDHYEPKMKEEYFGSHIPKDEAGYSKYIISKFIEGVENAIDLRVFGVFGKYEEYTIRFISNAICKTIFDLPITIKQNRRFDYIYIADLIRVVEYFMEGQNGFTSYNVTPDESIELKTLAEKVREISRKDMPIRIAKEGMGAEYSGDNTRLKNEMRDLNFTPLDEAIAELYAWHEENKKSLNRELLLVDY